MVESIIRRYKLYRKDLEFEEIHNDTMSFLITKINKFDHTKNHKAYSYFGTICKNYLMGAIQKDTKEQNRQVSYDDISSDIEDRPDLSYVIDEYIIDYRDVIIKLSIDLEEFVENEDLQWKVSSVAARVPRFLEEKVNIQDIHSLIIDLFDYLLYDLFVVIFE